MSVCVYQWWTDRAHLESAAELVAALIAAAEVRFKLTNTWRFFEAGPGRLALVTATLGVALLAVVDSDLTAVADLVGVVAAVAAAADFLSAVLAAGFVSFEESSAVGPFDSSLTSFSLFFSL